MKFRSPILFYYITGKENSSKESREMRNLCIWSSNSYISSLVTKEAEWRCRWEVCVCCALWIRFLSKVRESSCLLSGFLVFLLKHTLQHNRDLGWNSRERYWVNYMLAEIQWWKLYSYCYFMHSFPSIHLNRL